MTNDKVQLFEAFLIKFIFFVTKEFFSTLISIKHERMG